MLDRLDWSTRVETSAFDLTVTGDQGYFIAAADHADPVLVHNTSDGTFCDLPVPDEIAGELGQVRDGLDGEAKTGLTSVLSQLRTGIRPKPATA